MSIGRQFFLVFALLAATLAAPGAVATPQDAPDALYDPAEPEDPATSASDQEPSGATPGELYEAPADPDPSDAPAAAPPAAPYEEPAPASPPAQNPPGYDELYNPEDGEEQPLPQVIVEHDEEAGDDPADTAPTIRTYRPTEQTAAPQGLTEPREDPGLFGMYFPLTLYPELDTRSSQLQTWFFLGGLLPAGQAWLPLLVSQEPTPRGYLGDAALLAVVHALPHLVILATLPCGFVALGIPIVGALIFVGVFMLNLANVAAFLGTNFYFMPVAMLNAYDRAVRAPATTAEAHRGPPLAEEMAY